MSSVLHPVGPEPEERYWVRRLAVLVALVVALVVVIALVVNATSAGSAVQAEPSVPPPSPTVPAVTPTDSPSAGPSATPSGTPSASPSPSASPTASASPSATAKADTTAKSKADAEAAAKAQADAKAKAKAKAKAAKAKVAPLPACPSSTLRTTLTGDRTPQIEHPTTFSVSLINGSKQSCYLKVTSANFVLTVVSGSDRVWTTKDCATTVPTLSRTLKPEQAVGWKLVWNGQRSAQGCHNRSEKPRPGTYFAIATFDDATPVRLRMVAHR